MYLNQEHQNILTHTLFGAANKRYCGNSKEMQELVAAGLMVSLGKVSFCPDEYFTITKEGAAVIKKKGK